MEVEVVVAMLEVEAVVAEFTAAVEAAEHRMLVEAEAHHMPMQAAAHRISAEELRPISLAPLLIIMRAVERPEWAGPVVSRS